MVQLLCCIFDAVAGAWHSPLAFQSEAQAVRSFGDALSDGKSEFARHPEDYTLFAMGTFNPHDGSLVPLDAPKKLANGINLKEYNDGPEVMKQ